MDETNKYEEHRNFIVYNFYMNLLKDTLYF